ncbi:hypothetical protein L208DRAFT_1381515 [Tricholoma matsutake]|nr:hypothetical protein L208DRAFT_1381515 [Tricholoma matsutake 945]
MAKTTVSPFLEVGPTDAGNHHHSALAARSSVFASVVPKLRRLDISDDMLTRPKLPLLTLKLSSLSFLNSVVNDEFHEEPLYVMKTLGSSTSIERADPRGENAKTITADIKWPRAIPNSSKGVSDGILIQLRGARWKGGETLLRRGALPGSSRKFNIPNYSHTLKWSRTGTSYWCTTSSVKGPIAIFEPSNASLPARLVVFETLHDRYDARPMLVHHGVSLLLLDYLLVTSLLMVTDVQEWMTVKKPQEKDSNISHVGVDKAALAIPKLAPSHISTSPSQWRKIMFGEPLYQKPFSSRASVSPLSTAVEDALPSSPISMNEITALVYDQGRNSSSSDTSISGDEDDHVFFAPSLTCPPSPSSESIFYPLTPSSAPSHTYLDPSFYGESIIPPVPSIADRWKTPGSSSSLSRPSSEHSASSSSKQSRVLPMPPDHPLTPRPQSTPPQAMTLPGTNEAIPGSCVTTTITRRLPKQPHNTVPRGTLRRLPRPPSRDHLNSQSRALSHVRCRSQSQSTQPTEKWHGQYRQLPLPPVSSSVGSIGLRQEYRQRTDKEAEHELAEWVHALTNSAPCDYPAVPLPRTNFDIPPPAYNSLEFYGELENSSLPPLQSGVDP